MIIYHILDWVFTVFHTLLIIFNLTGWIWKPLRRINLITLLFTAGSWIILGLFYGFGYCPLTDWHFRVLYELGEQGLPSSYTQYLIHRVTHLSISSSQADAITLWGLIAALIFSVYYNIRDYLKSK